MNCATLRTGTPPGVNASFHVRESYQRRRGKVRIKPSVHIKIHYRGVERQPLACGVVLIEEDDLAGLAALALSAYVLFADAVSF